MNSRHEHLPVGAEVVWEHTQGRNMLSLVDVPVTSPVVVLYEKPSFGLEVAIAPTTEDEMWTVRGTIDPDTMSNLDLQVSQARRGMHPPVVTPGDIASMREFGQVEAVEPELFAVSLDLWPANIKKFFGTVWRPMPRDGLVVPAVDLGIDKSQRKLPQKLPTQGLVRSQVWMTVSKPQ